MIQFPICGWKGGIIQYSLSAYIAQGLQRPKGTQSTPISCYPGKLIIWYYPKPYFQYFLTFYFTGAGDKLPFLKILYGNSFPYLTLTSQIRINCRGKNLSSGFVLFSCVSFILIQFFSPHSLWDFTHTQHVGRKSLPIYCSKVLRK